jgi:glycosyltransferase involved in cell wall biosynthesis
VIPYARALARVGHGVTILSFEKDPEDPAVAPLAGRLATYGVSWTALRYHKRPPVLSTTYDVFAALLAAFRALRRGTGLIHARGHVPALVAEIVRVLGGTPYLFDHRGLMAEEFADAGIWRRGGFLYRLTSRMEDRFLRKAAAVVVLTAKYAAELSRPRVTVIPCAVDLNRFHPPARSVERPFDLVYAGSWSGLYLAQEMLHFFEACRRLRPAARFLVVVPKGTTLGSLPEGVEACNAAPAEVPALLRQARGGVSLRRAGRAQIAAAPVKVSEYLASGLAVVSSPGVGDLDEVLVARRVGIVVPRFDVAALEEAARSLYELVDDTELGDRCRRLAEERYAVEAAADAYDAAYRSISESVARRSHR